MQPSQELHDLVVRTITQMAAKNFQAILDVCSREPGILHLGTDPKEWMENLAAFEAVARPAIEGGSGNMPTDLEIKTGQEGTVGWSACRYTGHLPNGAVLRFRLSNVWHQEGGTWKTVHSHISLGVPDELVMNIAQPA